MQFGLPPATAKPNRHPRRDQLPQLWLHGCGDNRPRGFERKSDCSPREWIGCDLTDYRGIRSISLEKSAEVEPLHQSESQAVLKRRVEREVHEQIFARRHHPHLTRSDAASPPGCLEVQRKQRATGRDSAMQLDGDPQGGVEKCNCMVRLVFLTQARGLHEPHCPMPVIEHQEVDILHRPVGN